MRGERREAKLDGATLVPNSGRGSEKGDAKLGELLIDYKHNKSTFTLTYKAWKKMMKDAWNEGHRFPCIKVVYEDNTQVAIVDWNWLKQLMEDNDEH
jgi:hypothetical protein